MKKQNVLIFPAGTEIAFEIFNALKYSKFVKLFGANSIPSHAEFVFKDCVCDLPFEDDPCFIDCLNKLIDRWEIDLIYPAHDSACLTLTRMQSKIHAKVVSSPIETVDICRSKHKTYEYFGGLSFVPNYFNSVNEIKNYPVFIKPDVGQGSVGAKKIESREQLVNKLSSGKEFVICEYLPGQEYTVDCFTDRYGILRTCRIRQRERIKSGISVRSTIYPCDDQIVEIANTINQKLFFNGAWFFQVKKNDEGEYKLMEISPRIPGTMGTSRNLGINYPLLTIFNILGYDVEIIDNNFKITLDRAFINRYKTNVEYKLVYIDLDDTIYIEDKVNIMMIAFLYQCSNNGIPVVLLTKHNKNVKDTLNKYKISENLFSEIICIEKDDEKSKYIKESNSILIDDSFAERKNVHNAKSIPVYDLDMVESLIDWRM